MLQVTTVAQAIQAAEHGIDVIIAQGTEAGGYGGTISTMALVPQVVDAVSPVASPPEPLRGKRFLIVEDEPLIALEITAGLENAGMDVEGPVSSVEDALRAIDDDGSFDGVLLDANLRGEPAGEIAAALTRRNIPFVFVTGYGRQALPESFGQSPMLAKPFTQEQLLQTAARLVRTVPPGLRLHKDREPRT
jgi:CheY-like chemotaxis protein